MQTFVMRLYGQLLHQFEKNSSAAFLLFGAASVYVANLLGKQVLTTSEFVSLGLYIAYLSLLSTIALAGTEQLAIRFATFQPHSNTLEIPRSVVYLLLACIVALPPLFIHLFRAHFSSGYHIPLLPTITGTVAVSTSIIAMNVQRLLGKYNRAQIAANLWKASLLVAVSAACLDAAYLWPLIALGTAFSAITSATLAYQKSHISIKDSDFKIMQYAPYYLIATLTISAISFIDRYWAKELLQPNDLARYLYLTTALLLPFSMVATHVGFTNITKFKLKGSTQGIHKAAAKIGLATAVASIAWSAIFCTIFGATTSEEKLQIIAAVAILTGLRCAYSLYSAGMGACGKPVSILKANVLSIAIIALMQCILLFQGAATPFKILSVVAGLWLGRTITYAAYMAAPSRLKNEV